MSENDKRPKYKVISKIVEHEFDDALNEAIKEYYNPILSTFRVTKGEGICVAFTILVERVDEPGFVGKGTGFKNG